MDLSTDKSMMLFGIHSDIYDRSEVKAELQGRTVTDIVEEQLRLWLSQGDGNGEQTYIVRPGDTLARIAIELFGDPFKYALIAEHIYAKLLELRQDRRFQPAEAATKSS